MLVKGNKNFPTMKEEFISDIIRTNKLVIVEGKKDVAKLKKFRINKVKQLSRSPLYSFAEKVAKSHTEVILLMDNDDRGRKLYSKLKKEFSRLGVKTDETFQKRLADMDVSHVEGL